jgi:hypothetical protein
VQRGVKIFYDDDHSPVLGIFEDPALSAGKEIGYME